jgi:hypothetical protein
MKQWNDFEYVKQQQVMDLMEGLFDKCPAKLKECLEAAINELEIWANSPIDKTEEDGRLIAEAQFEEDDD